MTEVIATAFPAWTPAQQRGLALWVYGGWLAGSVCQSAVVTALLAYGNWHTIRAALREWLRDGPDKAAPCRTEIDVRACFAPLLGWVLRWWQGDQLPLAIDATTLGDRLVILAVSVLYQGTAIPVAWQVLPAPGRGAWIPAIVALLDHRSPALTPARPVLVMVDRGLWSPVLWDDLVRRGWQPVMRLSGATTVQPAGQRRQPARALIAGPGHAWIGAAVAFKDRPRRRAGTVIVVWAADQQQPWVLLTTLAPAAVGPCWYGGRMWIELGFRALKSMGWQWDRTRATDPERVRRVWLVLAVLTLWPLAVGTGWVADAGGLGFPPTHVLPPPASSALPARRGPRTRPASLLRLGMGLLRVALIEHWPWPDPALTPTPLPDPPPDLRLAYHLPPPVPIHL